MDGGQDYSDCFFCGGQVAEQRNTRTVWQAGVLRLVEDVPMGVCGQCGERFILPDVARRIDALLAGQARPDHFVQVPTYCFGDVETVS